MNRFTETVGTGSDTSKPPLRRRAAMLIFALCVTFTAACDSRREPPTPTATQSNTQLTAPLFPNWPAQVNEFRFHWSAAPGVDLEAGPAIALRAYVESYRLAGLAGGDSTALYPGFMRSTPENAGTPAKPDSVFQLAQVRPKTRAELETNGWTYEDRRYYGYQPTHVLSLAPQGNDYRATVCLGLYPIYETVADGNKYVSTSADPTTGQFRYGDWQMVEIWRVELTNQHPRATNTPTVPAAPQRGPLPAPIDDVFGPWFITGSSSALWGPPGQGEYIDPPEVRKQCEDAMPDDAATRKAMATGFHDSPPPHGDPIPGWPARTQ